MTKVRLTESQIKSLINRVIDEQIEINELTTDSTVLRKLARKSILNFGKHRDRSVQQILDLKHPAYLRWVYYNMGGISFLDDILREIGIIGDDYNYQIKKPGTNRELGKEVDEKKFNNASPHLMSHLGKMSRGERRQKSIGFKELDKRIFSKGNLQSWNQGRK
jgi:hypothetical protein